MARVGGAFALCIAPLGKIWKPLPMTVIGSFAVVAGVFAFAFPETTGLKLPETIKQALSIGKKESKDHDKIADGADNEAYND